MVERTLRTIALLSSAVVIVAFGLFAVDQTRSASAQARQEIAQRGNGVDDPDAIDAMERARVDRQNRVERAVERANDVVVAPFRGVAASSQSAWVRHGVPALLALLVFGLGLAFLARYFHAH